MHELEGGDIEGTIFDSLLEILKDYEDVFVKMGGLPPMRSHDHKICTKDGTQAVTYRLYRYGALYKDIIKKMMHEMLESRVVQNSTIFFLLQ